MCSVGVPVACRQLSPHQYTGGSNTWLMGLLHSCMCVHTILTQKLMANRHINAKEKLGQISALWFHWFLDCA